MRFTKLGDSDLELSALGLGTWAIGGGEWKFSWGPQDEREAIDAVVRAVELGVNWIDTAPVYGAGRSEELVGVALRQLGSAKPVIATKFGRFVQPDGNVQGCIKRESILAECEASLSRLGIDVIDLYQMHWPHPEEDIVEAWETMRELKRQGKVRHLGVCNFNEEQLQQIEAIEVPVSLQSPHSMLVRGVEERVLPHCQSNNIGFLAYSPMYKGMLTGKFTIESLASLAETDHRRRDPRFQSPQVEIHLQLVEELRPIAERNGRSLAELAIAWTLRRPGITQAIVGARSPRQIEETVTAGSWELTSADQSAVGACLERHAAALASA